MAETPNDLELRSRRLKSHQYTRKQQAVCVRNANKHYGSKKDPFVILNGLNMTVPKGSIYGLLGASGCGKSTLLSCIVGRKMLNSGEIWVLGGTPGSKGSGVPGPRIGYMPQDIALYTEFSIRETLIFFAWIANIVDKQRVQDRIDFLVELLMLPDANRAVKNLSGGQQRRVSFAAALVHEPELLILDEPTVGLDPLLRQNIWDHLLEITESKNATIIITTHYIDETRQAHRIGLMRGGYFLAEESPDKLLARFNVETLEEAFLKLSQKQDFKRGSRGSITDSVDDVDAHSQDLVDISGENEYNASISSAKHIPDNYAQAEDLSKLPLDEKPPAKISDYLFTVEKHHVQALIWKYYLWLVRNIPAMLLILGAPFIQISLFCICIGHNPSKLSVAIINYETNMSEGCAGLLQCNTTQLSCNFLEYLENGSLILVYYDSEESAVNSVLRGKTYASIVIKNNYTEALKRRVKKWQFSRQWDIEHSEIEVVRDVSIISIAYYLKVYLYQTFLNFVQDYLQTCGINRKVLALPVRMEEAIYGLNQPNFTDFAAPGIILTIIFFLALGLTAGAMLIERNEGGMERSFVSGITETEMLFSYIICQFVLMLLQSVIAITCTFGVFGMTQEGSLVLVVSLTLLAGFCGMCYGFTISIACDTERTATYMALGSLLPMILLGGIVWPIQAMHKVLQAIAFFLPLTMATESMRSIVQRNWGISNKVVYTGFISISIWIVIFLTISLLSLKFKKG